MLDVSLKPIMFNTEAIQILTHPENPQKMKSLGNYLADKVRTELLNEGLSGSSFITELISGKRLYICRAFHMDLASRNATDPSVVLLLERGYQGLINLSVMALQYHLTERERETVEHLLHGLTSKEIAERMKISPFTVKAFLRIVMLKTGVSTRSGILGKLIGLVDSSAPPGKLRSAR
ncbi:MAG: response regulator transcription factor [Nitrospirae bacterium]|nr:response regulator transcription factor [Nitrospirota bacterium]